jgi:hypothetical protein
MRRVWATAGSVWALLGVAAVLAWSHQAPVPAKPVIPVTVLSQGTTASGVRLVTPATSTSSNALPHAVTRTS